MFRQACGRRVPEQNALKDLLTREKKIPFPRVRLPGQERRVGRSHAHAPFV